MQGSRTQVSKRLSEADRNLIQRVSAALDQLSPGGFYVEARLKGSLSSGEAGGVFRAYKQNPRGGRAETPCVIKVGEYDRLRQDYDGWHRFVAGQGDPNSFVRQYPPVQVDDGRLGVLWMDFVGVHAGEECLLLSEAWQRDQSILEPVISRVVENTLKNLHEHHRPPGRGNWFDQRPQKDVLQLRIRGDREGQPGDHTRARATLESHGLLRMRWDQDCLEDYERGYSVRNHVSELVRNRTILSDNFICAFPKGAIHGDPNPTNIFVSVERASRGKPRRVGLMDFERWREWHEDRPFSPFDDLARIECDLLFCTLPLMRPPEARSDTALVHVAATWPWDLGEGAPAGLSEGERGVFAALRAVRRRAVEIGIDAGCSDLKALERGYFACLLGRAFSYLHYSHYADHVPAEEARPRAFEACLLLAERLASPMCDPPQVRFPEILAGPERGRGVTWDCDGTGYRIRAERGLQHLRLKDALGDVRYPQIELEFQMTAVSDPERAWVGVAIGASRDSFESGLRFCLRANGQLVYVSESGNVTRHGEPIESPTTKPVGLKVTAGEGQVRLTCGTKNLSWDRLVPEGRIYIGAFGCEATIVRFSASGVPGIN